MSVFSQLKTVVEQSETRAGRVFDIGVMVLIVITLAAFAVDTLPGLSPAWKRFLWWVEMVSVVVFSLEYVTRLAVADSRWRFGTSFFGIIDLVAILPFFLSVGIDLRSLRVLRLLRMFRVLKLFRYSRAVLHFRLAFQLVREELILFFCATLMILFIAASGIHAFESEVQPTKFGSVFESLWWAVVTLTTVGYGDAYPITPEGRMFTSLVIMAGLGTVAVPAGLLSSAITTAREMVNKTDPATGDVVMDDQLITKPEGH